MNTYFVYMPTGEGRIAGAFPDAHHEVAHNLWAIGSHLATCADVCEKLGVNEGAGRSMVVVQTTGYYGRFDPALWQKLDAWRERE